MCAISVEHMYTEGGDLQLLHSLAKLVAVGEFFKFVSTFAY